MSPVFPTEPFDFDASWPESWRVSHQHDVFEIWGDRSNPGYSSAYRRRMAQVLAMLERYTPPGGNVLDLAAAQGNYSLTARAKGYRVTWNDLRGELADYVRLKSPLAAELEFVPGNILELGDRFRGAFDTVLALEVIEHVAHPDRFLDALASLSRPGGRLIISTPNGGFFRNKLPRFSDCPDASVFESVQFKPDSDGHIFLLHEDEILSLAARAGLVVLEHQLLVNPLSAGYLGTRHLHPILPPAAIGAVEALTRRLPGPVSRRLNLCMVTVLARPD